MSVVVYLGTDPHHVTVSQGIKVTPGTFLQSGQPEDDGQPLIDVEDGQGKKVASFARAEVVGYYIQSERSG